MLSKRERLEKTIAGEAVDRTPVALWRHWPGDDQRPADLVWALLNFQQQWDFDFLVISPAMADVVTDYGLQAHWAGEPDSSAKVTVRPIARSLDWTELEVLDPRRGKIGQQLELVRMMHEAVKGALPFILTIYSPLTQAALLAGEELLLKHIRTAPERLKTGLNVIVGNTLRLLDALQFQGLAGIRFVVQHADYRFLSSTEYVHFGQTYDLQILHALSSEYWLNVLSVEAALPMMPMMSTYPVQVLNWQDGAGDFDLAAAKLEFSGAVCGGVSSPEPLLTGTPRQIREDARLAFELVNNRRHILGVGRPLPILTPQSNIRAVRDAIELTEIQL